MLFGRTETSELTVPVNPPCFQWRYNRPSDTSSHYSTADPRHSEPRDSVMTPGRPCKRLKKWAQMISELEIIFSECDKWGKWRSRNEDLRTMAAAAFTENSNSAILNERNWNLVILFFSSKKRNYRVFTIISHMQEYIMKSRSIEKIRIEYVWLKRTYGTTYVLSASGWIVVLKPGRENIMRKWPTMRNWTNYYAYWDGAAIVTRSLGHSDHVTGTDQLCLTFSR